MEFDKDLDVRGLNCPLPVIKTKKTLNEMAPGQVLRVATTDSGSLRDMAAFARQSGHALLSSETTPDDFVFYLRRK